MNLYLFIYPKDQDLSDQEIWNEGRYAAAVWESCDLSALKFAQEFYAESTWGDTPDNDGYRACRLAEVVGFGECLGLNI